MSRAIFYEPADPTNVVTVDRMRLYTDEARTVLVEDLANPVQQPDGSWQFASSSPDGTYYLITTVTYTEVNPDGSNVVADDSDDYVTLGSSVGCYDCALGLTPWVDPSTVVPSTATLAIRARAVSLATEILWALSGRRFGVCRVEVRPSPDPGVVLDSTLAYAAAGVSFSPLASGGVSSALLRMDADRVMLPGRVNRVERVTIDGVPLDPSAYRIDQRRWLIRQDGGTWPISQDVSLPNGAVGTFSVTYQVGLPVPEGGRGAAALLASEFVKALTDDKSCRLPSRTQSVSRQGVTIVTGSQDDYLDKGRTGVPEVDLWLTSVNPHRLPQASRASSPDVLRPFRVYR